MRKKRGEEREEGAKRQLLKTEGEPAVRRGRGEIGVIRSYFKANVSLKCVCGGGGESAAEPDTNHC